ncbi:MAG: hypothetical protein JJT75_00420 [Opitutales bacterium]|nr:hypothetical protein [Opitutales bacterium]MCH8541485.1 hypothetical protein [Opitutales bacterium]
MSNLTAQQIIIRDLARENVAQRAQLNKDWQSLSESRGTMATTFKIAYAAAKAAPMVTMIFRLTLGRPPSRKHQLRVLLRRLLR